jgi:hypothetical protein
MKISRFFKQGIILFTLSLGIHLQSFAGTKDIGVGIERLAFLGGGSLNTLHGRYEITPSGAVGASFGFANDFDVIYFGGDYKHELIKTTAASLFATGNLGFIKGLVGGGADTNNSGFSAAALLGFEYSLTSQLKISMAYGLQFLFGLGDNTFGFTNNDAFGNFGIHWYL